jgi:4-hydroxybenzoate polyprenyltransferase
LPANQAGTIFLSAFPPKFLIFFLLLTFPANFIDIKDYAGDKAAGIRTLPVILGEKKAARLIGIFFLFPFIYIAWIMPETAPISLLGGLIGYRFIDNRNYDERKIFILILINLFLLAIKLLLNLHLF